MSTRQSAARRAREASAAPLWRGFALCLCASLLACHGATLDRETGSQCWDGKDNDGDGLIDCRDPDCAALALCGGVVDGGPDSGRPPDLAQRDRALPPDLTSPSSYGAACTYNGKVSPCPDGKTVCIQTPSGKSYCTYPCSSVTSLDCPTAAPPGQEAKCLYEFSQQDYCLFLCRFGGKTFACPAHLSCLQVTSTQANCL